MQHTFYLFDKSVKDFDSAVNGKKLKGPDGFSRIPLLNTVTFEARAYFQRNKSSRPKWLDFISPHIVL